MKFKLDESLSSTIKGVLPLTEANLNRIVKGHDKDGYVVLSASREENKHVDGDVEGEYKKNPYELNDIRTKQMRKLIYDKGYTYIPILGGYHEEGTTNSQVEKSFIVYPYKRNKNVVDFDVFLNDIYDIVNAKDDGGNDIFNQDSILVHRPNGTNQYVNPRTRDVDFEPGDNVIYNDTDQTYFSALKNWKDTVRDKSKSFDKGNAQRFTFTECYIVPQPMTIMSGASRSGQGELCVVGFSGRNK